MYVAFNFYDSYIKDDDQRLIYKTQLLYFTHTITTLRKKDEEEDSTLEHSLLFSLFLYFVKCMLYAVEV